MENYNITLKNEKNIKNWITYDLLFNDKQIQIETPFMYLPFGVEQKYNDYIIKLQFKGLKKMTEENKNLEDFYYFIKNIERKISNILKIEKNKKFISRLVEKKNYDDLLEIKINKKFYNIEIKNVDNTMKNIYDIHKGSYIKCFLAFGKIWMNKDVISYKLLVDKIIIKNI